MTLNGQQKHTESDPSQSWMETDQFGMKRNMIFHVCVCSCFFFSMKSIEKCEYFYCRICVNTFESMNRNNCQWLNSSDGERDKERKNSERDQKRKQRKNKPKTAPICIYRSGYMCSMWTRHFIIKRNRKRKQRENIYVATEAMFNLCVICKMFVYIFFLSLSLHFILLCFRIFHSKPHFHYSDCIE